MPDTCYGNRFDFKLQIPAHLAQTNFAERRLFSPVVPCICMKMKHADKGKQLYREGSLVFFPNDLANMSRQLEEIFSSPKGIDRILAERTLIQLHNGSEREINLRTCIDWIQFLKQVNGLYINQPCFESVLRVLRDEDQKRRAEQKLDVQSKPDLQLLMPPDPPDPQVIDVDTFVSVLPVAIAHPSFEITSVGDGGVVIKHAHLSDSAIPLPIVRSGHHLHIGPAVGAAVVSVPHVDVSHVGVGGVSAPPGPVDVPPVAVDVVSASPVAVDVGVVSVPRLQVSLHVDAVSAASIEEDDILIPAVFGSDIESGENHINPPGIFTFIASINDLQN
jgi:hypothetical protein